MNFLKIGSLMKRRPSVGSVPSIEITDDETGVTDPFLKANDKVSRRRVSSPLIGFKLQTRNHLDVVSICYVFIVLTDGSVSVEIRWI